MGKEQKKLAAKVAAKAEIRERARTDKMFLANEILGYDFCPDVHAELFANYPTYDSSKPWGEQSEIKNRMILWSRGFFKTSSVVSEIVQIILNFPDSRILIMQGSVPNTKTLLREIKSHFDGTNFRSKFKDVFPEFCVLSGKFGTAMDFTVPCRTRTLKDPTVGVASPRTVRAGRHVDCLFGDDLQNEMNFRNPRLVQKGIEDFSLCVPLVDPGGYKFLTGTRYSPIDIYMHFIRQDSLTHEWSITVKQCWHEENGAMVSNFPPRKLADGRTIGISMEQLLSIQRADPEMFSCQYLNAPILASQHLFPEELIMSHVRSCDVQLGPPTLFIDLAASKKDDRDCTVILCGRQDSLGRLYVTDCVGGQWGPLEAAKAVVAQALKQRPTSVQLEGTAAGMIFAEFLKTVATDVGVRVPVQLIKVDNRKDAKHFRILTVSSLLKQDKLFFLAGLPAWDMMLEQFVAYPRTKHDDFPDTVALMCQHYAMNNYVVPKTVSIGSFILKNAAQIPEIIKQPMPQGELAGSLGGAFED